MILNKKNLIKGGKTADRKKFANKHRNKLSFKRDGSHKLKRVKESWRRPKGTQSKVRKKLRGRKRMPSVGYGSPKYMRGLNSLGYHEILVNNVNDIESIPKDHIARIASQVGKKKRIEIEKKAKELKIPLKV